MRISNHKHTAEVILLSVAQFLVLILNNSLGKEKLSFWYAITFMIPRDLKEFFMKR
jgi:hypothetical protein